jgi:hypothetical protein
MPHTKPDTAIRCSYNASSCPMVKGVNAGSRRLIEGRLPEKVLWGMRCSGTPSLWSCSADLPRANASGCRKIRISLSKLCCIGKDKNKLPLKWCVSPTCNIIEQSQRYKTITRKRLLVLTCAKKLHMSSSWLDTGSPTKQMSCWLWMAPMNSAGTIRP